MKLLALVISVFISSFIYAQDKKLNVMAGYNFGYRPLDYQGYDWRSHMRLNTTYYFNTKIVAPMLELNFLMGSFNNHSIEYQGSGGYNAWRRHDFQQSEILGSFGMGMHIPKPNKAYWNLIAGFTALGWRKITGCTSSKSPASYTDSSGRSGTYLKYEEECYEGKVETIPDRYIQPFFKVEYGFQSKFTQKLNLNYKVGLSTFNVYFLMGISKKPKA